MPTAETVQTAARGYAALAEDLARLNRYQPLYNALERLSDDERRVISYRWGVPSRRTPDATHPRRHAPQNARPGRRTARLLAPERQPDRASSDAQAPHPAPRPAPPDRRMSIDLRPGQTAYDELYDAAKRHGHKIELHSDHDRARRADNADAVKLWTIIRPADGNRHSTAAWPAGAGFQHASKALHARLRVGGVLA